MMVAKDYLNQPDSVVEANAKANLNRGEGWTKINCGLCVSGIEKSTGYTPRTCSRCKGRGFYYEHKSGLLAEYPGGPALGSVPQ
jgi:hypothetical protein